MRAVFSARLLLVPAALLAAACDDSSNPVAPEEPPVAEAEATEPKPTTDAGTWCCSGRNPTADGSLTARVELLGGAAHRGPHARRGIGTCYRAGRGARCEWQVRSPRRACGPRCAAPRRP